MGKSGPNAALNVVFLGLGWPWVGEFVDFILIVIYIFPTQQNLVNGKHRNKHIMLLLTCLVCFAFQVPWNAVDVKRSSVKSVSFSYVTIRKGLPVITLFCLFLLVSYASGRRASSLQHTGYHLLYHVGIVLQGFPLGRHSVVG